MSTVLVQQLDRFQGAHRYHGKQPLAELTFVATVWRASVIEEERREQLCQVRFGWGTKFASPSEKISDAQHWVRNAFAVAGQQQVPRPPVATAGDDVEMVATSPPPDATTYDVHAAVQRHPLWQAIASCAVGSSFAEQARAYFDAGENLLFTRPPVEDYVDPTEFISPIEPQQATSPLAAIVLSHHRTEHRGNPNMHLMWSIGHLETLSGLGGPGYGNTKLPLPPGSPAADVMQLQWRGEDIVFCTVSKMANSDTAFLAKPSLNEEHTLLVTSKHIYTFKVSVVEATAVAPRASTPNPPDMHTSANMTSFTAAVAAVSPGASPRGFTDTTDVNRLIAHGAAATADHNAPLYITDATERERRTMLRQAVLKGRAAGNGASRSPRGQRTPLTNAGQEVVFTPPPPFGDGTADNPTMRRVHIFGTMESIHGVHRDSLFVRMTWQLPEGAVVDEGTNTTTGTACPMSITTQLAFGCRVLNAEYQFDTVHHFNVPFELHVLVPVHQPKHVSMVFAVYGAGAGGDDHATPEGYASAWFSTEPGTRQQTSSLWKPRMTGYEYLRHIFIGGGPSLAEESCVGLPPYASTGTSSKLGLMCESSGTVKTQYFVVVHEHATNSKVIADAGPGAAKSILAPTSAISPTERRSKRRDSSRNAAAAQLVNAGNASIRPLS